ncbi:MAG: hypothetical protein H7287_06440 [Thermoleophilia bacterium]|nr:hypothetical protein [Thermoleophilia bacterium]
MHSSAKSTPAADDDELVARTLSAMGHACDEPANPAMLPYAIHPSPDVRFAVATAAVAVAAYCTEQR